MMLSPHSSASSLCFVRSLVPVVTLLPLLLPTPLMAHEVNVSGNVAATFHIEPGHNPKAGQPSRTWFALTQRGGALIPLAQCDCQLAVYAVPRRQNTPAMLRPALAAYNVEGFKNIPSAMVTFPRPGLYELELSGKPKGGVQFNAFRLSYRVTVGR
jgi:hypothetical protein